MKTMDSGIGNLGKAGGKWCGGPFTLGAVGITMANNRKGDDGDDTTTTNDSEVDQCSLNRARWNKKG